VGGSLDAKDNGLGMDTAERISDPARFLTKLLDRLRSDKELRSRMLASPDSALAHIGATMAWVAASRCRSVTDLHQLSLTSCGSTALRHVTTWPPRGAPTRVPLGYEIAPAEKWSSAAPDGPALDLRALCPWIDFGDPYASQHFGAGPYPRQGWNLVVSATPENACEIWARVAPILLEANVRFHVANSIAAVRACNGGRFGPGRIGHFVIVYPSDDEQAAVLAEKLFWATTEFEAPRPLTAIPLCRGGIVAAVYRQFYPDFPAVDPAESLVFDGEGRQIRSRIGPFDVPIPEHLRWPFARFAQIEPARAAGGGVFADRYLVLELIATGACGRVYRAIDLLADPPRLCVLKEFWQFVALDDFERDAIDRGLLEASVLSEFQRLGVFAELLDVLRYDGNLFLVLSHISGETLSRWGQTKWAEGQAFSFVDLFRLAHSLAEILLTVHEAGLILRDLKPDNVMIGEDGEIRLIDLALSYRVHRDRGPPLGRGTIGYMAPEQASGAPAAIAQDVYGFGTTIRYIATGIEPWEVDDVGRPVPSKIVNLAECRPDLPPEFSTLVDRCVAAVPSERPADFRSILVEIDRIAKFAQAVASPASAETDTAMSALTVEATGWLAQAVAVGERLREAAEPIDGGLRWIACPPTTGIAVYSPDIFDGAAGIGLFLLALYRATGLSDLADVAEGIGRWLAGREFRHGRRDIGLYRGEAGIGWYFLTLAETLGRPEYLQACAARARRMAGISTSRLSLAAGTAGAVVFSARLFAVTGWEWVHELAVIAGNRLMAARDEQGLAGRQGDRLGLYHGDAGIGLALVLLYHSTGDARFLEAARRIGRSLVTVEIGDDVASGNLELPDDGSVGVARFLLKLGAACREPYFIEAATRLADMLSRRCRNTSGLAAGVAGDGCLFLDIYAATSSPRFLDYALQAAVALDPFRIVDEEGRWASNRMGHISPDLMTGYSGVGIFLLQLANPATTVDLLFGHVDGQVSA
jgi:hypothetical protein